MAKYVYKWVDREDFKPIMENEVKKIFDRTTVFFPDPLYSTQEKNRNKKNSSNLKSRFTLSLIVYLNGKPVAWSAGEQQGYDTFHMNISAVLPRHRQQSLYSKMLTMILKETAKHGFQKVQSYHHPNNTPILIAKLKAGFVVSGFELEDVMGALVRLTYYHHPARKKVFDYRTGSKHLPKKIRSKFPKGQI